MKKLYRSVLAALAVAHIAFTLPVTAAPLRQSGGTVTASAEVVPVQTSEMAFLIPGPVQEVDVKEGEQVKAGQTLIMLNTPDMEYSVAGAEAALASAQAEAALARFPRKVFNGDRFLYLSGPPEKRQIADDKVVQAQAALDIAKATLAQNTLVAPYDGTVVSLHVAAGEMVQATRTAAVIATLDQLQIETTDLSERDVTKIAVGQVATVHVESLNQDFSGKVTAISPKADIVGGDVVYKVTIQFDEQPEGLLWGMTATVEINTGS